MILPDTVSASESASASERVWSYSEIGYHSGL